MENLRELCRALYDAGFPEESDAFREALFDLAFPRYLRVIREGEQPVSMLFSIPYEVIDRNERVSEARYLYAVVTHPDFRGRGLARQLLRAEMARGVPLFLRPMSPSLFPFYESVGLLPFSSHEETKGEATAPLDGVCALDAGEYLALRRRLLPRPLCQPTAEFLSLHFLFGGAVAVGESTAALYEKNGDTVFFKEWIGDPKDAPRVAAFLGAERYRMRIMAKNGTPFGVQHGMPADAHFLLALD